MIGIKSKLFRAERILYIKSINQFYFLFTFFFLFANYASNTKVSIRKRGHENMHKIFSLDAFFASILHSL